MEMAVRYQSRGGNTRVMAEEIARRLGVTAEPVTAPLPERTELLVLGGGTYAFKPDKEMSAFIAALSPEKVGRVVLFATASGTMHAIRGMKKALEEKGIPVDERYKLLRLGAQGNTLLGKKGGTLTDAQKAECAAFADTIK